MYIVCTCGRDNVKACEIMKLVKINPNMSDGSIMFIMLKARISILKIYAFCQIAILHQNVYTRCSAFIVFER